MTRRPLFPDIPTEWHPYKRGLERIGYDSWVAVSLTRMRWLASEAVAATRHGTGTPETVEQLIDTIHHIDRELQQFDPPDAMQE